VSEGGYYKWRKRTESARAAENRRIIDEIRKIHLEVKGIYGSPRMTVELNSRGYQCCENTVAKLMRENGIRAKMDRRYKPRQWKPGSGIKKGNLLEGREDPTRPHEVWVADFTYMKQGGSFKYLSVVMDLYTRKIVGMEISRKRDAEMVQTTLRKALSAHPGANPEIFHSDRGIEYANHAVGGQLKKLGIRQSMSGKGNCYDNAHMESFFHTYKSEHYYTERHRTHAELKQKTVKYIQFYNESRLHSSLGYMSPVDFENSAMESVNF
jgi:transposase InsO family protein